jgi:hypothetical protein
VKTPGRLIRLAVLLLIPNDASEMFAPAHRLALKAIPKCAGCAVTYRFPSTSDAPDRTAPTTNCGIDSFLCWPATGCRSSHDDR